MRTSYNIGNHGTFETAFEGNFFNLSYKTDASVDPGGNSGYPSVLTIYAEQMANVIVDPHGSTVTMEFVGTQEFFEFHHALALLVRDMNAAFGDPLRVKP